MVLVVCAGFCVMDCVGVCLFFFWWACARRACPAVKCGRLILCAVCQGFLPVAGSFLVVMTGAVVSICAHV